MKSSESNAAGGFQACLPAPVIFYGAGGGGRQAFEYFQDQGWYDYVDCFIDDDPARQGQCFCDRPIRSREILRNRPEALVVTTTLFADQVARTLKKEGLDNQLYSYFAFDPWYDQEQPFTGDADLVRSFYEAGDPYTQDLLKAIIEYRTAPTPVRVKKFEDVKAWLTMHASFDPACRQAYWTGDIAAVLGQGPLTFVDGGASIGDTMVNLLSRFGGRVKRFYAFEPGREIFRSLVEAAAKMPIKIDCLQAAMSDVNGEAYLDFDPVDNGATSHLSEAGGEKITCRRLDDCDIEVEGRLCLKMDIEGSELAALAGGAELIRTHRPFLAICVYHKANDLFEIPRYIKSLVPEYRFALRGGDHTVAYGWVDG